jgi:hypothetical protein
MSTYRTPSPILVEPEKDSADSLVSAATTASWDSDWGDGLVEEFWLGEAFTRSAIYIPPSNGQRQAIRAIYYSGPEYKKSYEQIKKEMCVTGKQIRDAVKYPHFSRPMLEIEVTPV